MRAAVIDAFGGPEVVRVTEIPAPSPGPGDVLVRVAAAGVNTSDARIRGRRFPEGFGVIGRLVFGVRRPRRRVLGGSCSGVIESVGSRVTQWRPGDEVVGTTGMRLGAHAELVAVPAARVVAKPAGVTHEQAAGAVFGGTTALFFLRDRAAIHPGSSVLVVGASGAIGTSAVQLAAQYGGTVTAVASAANAALATRLGASAVIDHHSVDVASLRDQFDVVFDTVGALGLHTGRRLLTPDGVLLLAVGSLRDTVMARGNARAGTSPERPADITVLLDLVAEGRLEVVVEDVLDLDDIRAAHARVDSGHKVGNLVVRIAR